jgi:LysR family hca operon transcriptional activator
VTYRILAQEPIVAIIPRDRRLATLSAIPLHELESKIFIGYSEIPHVLREIMNRYLRRLRLNIKSTHCLDNFTTGISLVASTGGNTLLPTYVVPLLPESVVRRPLGGRSFGGFRSGLPTGQPVPLLAGFLERIDQLMQSGRDVVQRSQPKRAYL